MDDIGGIITAIIVILSVIGSIIKAANKNNAKQNYSNKATVNKPGSFNNTQNTGAKSYNSLNNRTNTVTKTNLNNTKPKVEDIFSLRNYKSESSIERKTRLDDELKKSKVQSSIKPTVNPYNRNDSLEFQEVKDPKLSSWTNKHPSEYNSKVERAYVESSSEGEPSEGCAEHYNTRLVMVDKETNNEISFSELQKVIIFGEIINTPKYKEF